jgi:RimJ/RimL family protein N-acetyltransferase
MKSKTLEWKTPNLETPRLLLRPWREDDAEALYQYARDLDVGPAAGWPPHMSVENSREILRGVLSEPVTWAVVPKEIGLPVGSLSVMADGVSGRKLPENEAEIGYWIGKPYWGRGLIPEAVRRAQRYAFEELGMARLWCGYFDGNEKSKRVQEKCGFVYHHTVENVECPLIGETRTEHFTTITREEWAARLHGTDRFGRS